MYDINMYSLYIANLWARENKQLTCLCTQEINAVSNTKAIFTKTFLNLVLRRFSEF